MASHPAADESVAGPELIGPVTVGPIAHGGHCVVRYEGRVIFVRHALPGEQVIVAITDVTAKRFWRGDAVEIIQPSPDRVVPPCPIARPAGCGGCDFQHVELAAQRRLKATVVSEQLAHLAGVSWTGEVEPLPDPGDRPGLGWRTRMHYRVDDQGRAALRKHRSHQLIPLPDRGCLLATPQLPEVAQRRWPPGSELNVVAGSEHPTVLIDGAVERGEPTVGEQAAGRSWQVAATGFWQVHPDAAETLANAVAEALRPRAGERALDLYCGVGLFAGVLADAGCQVWAVESDRTAVQHARHNLADLGAQVRLIGGDVDRVLRRRGRGSLPPRTDLVVVDPPRSGCGAVVIRQLIAKRPRAIAYVACDPAALARDVATAVRAGYRLESLRAFDLFPMTQHVECLAILTPGQVR